MIPWFTALPFFLCLDFKKKEAFHVARFEKDSRYYVLRLEKDLLDYWTITAVNGRIRSKLGQSRTLAFPTFNDAFESFCGLAKHRFKRKYHLKTIACDSSWFVYLLPYLLNIEVPMDKTYPGIKKTKPKSIINNCIQPLYLTQTIPQQMGFIF